MSRITLHQVAVASLLFLVTVPYVTLGIMCFLAGTEPVLDPTDWHPVWRSAFIIYELACCAALAPFIMSALEN